MVSKKVLAFGGAGFLGKSVVREYLRRGYSVTVADIVDLAIENVSCFQIDVLKDNLREFIAFHRPDIIINLVAQPDISSTIERFESSLNLNINANVRVLEGMRGSFDGRYVYASSLYAASDVGAFYSIAKRTSELVTKEFSKRFGLDYIILRYGSVYGVGAGKSNRIVRYIEDAIVGKIRIDGDPSERRSYIHVDDAATLTGELVEKGKCGAIYRVTGSTLCSSVELAELIFETLGKESDISFERGEVARYTRTPHRFFVDEEIAVNMDMHIGIDQGLAQIIEVLASRKPY